jgi:hypothetical protein
MSFSERAADALEWVQLGLWASSAGITFGLAFGWVVGVCITCGFLAICALVARRMKAHAAPSFRATVPQRRVQERSVCRASR